jgi:hypothetical protein
MMKDVEKRFSQTWTYRDPHFPLVPSTHKLNFPSLTINGADFVLDMHKFPGKSTTCPRNFLRSVMTARKKLPLPSPAPELFSSPAVSHIFLGRPLGTTVSLRSRRKGERRVAVGNQVYWTVGRRELMVMRSWGEREEGGMTTRCMQTEDEELEEGPVAPVIRRTFDWRGIPETRQGTGVHRRKSIVSPA